MNAQLSPSQLSALDILTPVQKEFVIALRLELQDEGKIRWIGVSNFGVEQLTAGKKVAGIVSTQPQYSLVDRGIEGIAARVSTTRGDVELSTPLVGRANLANVLAATTVALEFDVPLADIAERARHLKAAAELSHAVFYWLQTEAPREDGGQGFGGLRLRGDRPAPRVRKARPRDHQGPRARRADADLQLVVPLLRPG